MSMSQCEIDRKDEDGCEICGAVATCCYCSVEVEVGAQTKTTSRMLCVRCAKAEGVYPSVWERLFGVLMYLLIWPFRGYLARKYPPEYWRARVEEIKRRRRGQESASDRE